MKYKIFPIFTELNVKQDPADIYARIGLGEPCSFLLDCPEVGRNSRFAFISGKARDVLRSQGTSGGNFLNILQTRLSEIGHPAVRGLPDFLSGVAGFLGYEACHWFEKIPRRKKDDLHLPDAAFIFPSELLILDRLKKKGWASLMVRVEKRARGALLNLYRESRQRLVSFAGACEKAQKSVPAPAPGRALGMRSSVGRKNYLEGVRRVKEYIAAGDIYQANLSHRFSGRFYGSPFSVYKRLRCINPSPFACYFDFGDFQLISSSPERLLRVSGRRAETRPIAGTRPRGKTPGEDRELRAELLLSPKERAEHIMLVDLERNDLGRVCDPGSVAVNESLVLEKYSHVTHIVSNVAGRLKKDKNGMDALAALFPGGTITGAPKIRCMEILAELERDARGPYTGSAGWIAASGNMDFNILIRTILIKNKMAYISVGSGIVADSIPEREWEESLHKAQAMLEALH